MRTLMLALPLAVIIGCGGPAPEGEPPGATSEEAPDPAPAEEQDEEEALELPPEGALPLSEILARLEAAGHVPIVEIELEDGMWEVEFVVDGEEQELKVDPLTGEIIDDVSSEEESLESEAPAERDE